MPRRLRATPIPHARRFVYLRPAEELERGAIEILVQPNAVGIGKGTRPEATWRAVVSGHLRAGSSALGMEAAAEGLAANCTGRDSRRYLRLRGFGRWNGRRKRGGRWHNRGGNLSDSGLSDFNRSHADREPDAYRGLTACGGDKSVGLKSSGGLYSNFGPGCQGPQRMAFSLGRNWGRAEE